MGAYICIGATIFIFSICAYVGFQGSRTHAAGSRDKKLIKGALKEVVDHLKNTDGGSS
jgi:hypothetical protein